MKKGNNVLLVLSFFLFFTILIIFIFNFISKKDAPGNDALFETDLLGSGTAKTFERKTANRELENSNVSLEPYGCFTNIKNQFFQARVNPYSKNKEGVDASFFISDGAPDKPLEKLIKNIIKNGYNSYGNKILKKYEKVGSSGISLLEIAKLGKLSGYNYISILKYPEGSQRYGKIYLTYSPPTKSSSLYKYNNNFTDDEFKDILTDSDLQEYTLTPKLNNDTSDTEDKSGKELSCGYPCTINDVPETFKDSQGVVRQYMCGSVNYPSIKTPEHYAIYKIN
jgi:hypothetical protein